MRINIFYEKDKMTPNEEKTENDLSVKDKSILDYVEKIVEISTKSGIEKSLSEGKKHLDYVSKKLGIKYMECEELEKKKLIRCSRGGNGVSYRLNLEAAVRSLRPRFYFEASRADGRSVFYKTYLYIRPCTKS
jgi:hypothetical protein